MMGVASILSLSAITSLFVLRHCKAIFLHDGCLIQEQYNIDTFEDSLTFLMLFPPEDDFFLSVSQDSPTSYFYPARGRYRGPKAWMQVELHLGDSIELRFENGTAWMKELRTRERLFPRASVSMSLGFLAADCPQKTPFWTLREKAASLTRELWNHQNITYSLYSTAESWVYLAIGREVLLLCWDNATAQLLVGPADLRENHCVDSGQFLPALQMLWLQVTFEEGLVTLSSPENNGQILRSLYKNTDSVTLNFKTKRTRGEVYVVEHISGYPRPADALLPSYRKVSSFRTNNWAWACVSVVGVLLLVLLSVAVSFAVVFYSRWQKAREVLLLLRKMQDESGQANKAEPDASKNNLYTPHPVPPPVPLPLLSPPSVTTARSSEGQYLTPIVYKTLVESEHVYEEIGAVAGWSSSRKEQGEENTAFETLTKKGRGAGTRNGR